MALRTLALCAGVGGLELGVHLATGGRSRVLAYVERDPFAAAVLVARMEDSSLGQAPVWDDVVTFDGAAWRGRVDLVTAGFPCQPWSSAGNGQGEADERWLWPDIARVIGDVGPSLVFLENVPPLAVRGGIAVVLGNLADLGFDAEWSLLSAAEVGAPHKRQRLFILGWRDVVDPSGQVPGDQSEGHEPVLRGWFDQQTEPIAAGAGDVAYRHDRRLPVLGGGGLLDRERTTCGHDADRSGSSAVADAGSGGCQPWVGDDDAGQPDITGLGSPMADAPDDGPIRGRPAGRGRADHERDRAGPAVDRQSVADATSEGQQRCMVDNGWLRSDLGDAGLWPPRPDDHDGWRRTSGPQPSVCRVADGLAHRLDRLHAIGNGVVPLVAAHAFIGLARRAGLT